MVNSEQLSSGGTQQLLLKLAEQLGQSSHELAKVAQQIAGLRQKLEQIERAAEQARRGDAEV